MRKTAAHSSGHRSMEQAGLRYEELVKPADQTPQSALSA
jgi:hypothetical protein